MLILFRGFRVICKKFSFGLFPCSLLMFVVVVFCVFCVAVFLLLLGSSFLT